ncbi:hypothetical protein D3C78_1005940 [compost metagenome]
MPDFVGEFVAQHAQRSEGRLGATVKQGRHDGEGQRLFARAIDHRQGVDHALKAFDRQMLGLHRDHQLLARRQGIDHQHAEQGRAVDHGVIEVLPQLRQALGNHQAQTALPRRLALKGGQCGAGGQQGDALVTGRQQQLTRQTLGHVALVQEQVVVAVFQGIGVVAEVAGHGAVGVEIDHDHALARLRQ